MHRALGGTVVAFVLASAAGCSSQPKTDGATRPARINHVVFLKLNDPAEADALIADSDAMLATIPGVVSYYAGQHIDTGRSTVLNDYDVGLYIGFDTEEDYAVYVEHPQHVGYVTKWRPRLAWLKVYDIEDRNKKWEMGNGKWEIGNRKSEMGNGKWEMGSGKWDLGSGTWEVGSGRWTVGE